ncbi:MAG: Mth938-like domain-containing protein [Thiohalomonadaceae bacterium]
MKISLENTVGTFVIQAYAPGEIHVQRPFPNEAGERIAVCRRSIIITPERLIGDWAPQSFEELNAQHFDALEELAPEVVLVGTGTRLRLPSPPVLAPLVHLRAGFEVMDTGAACRTYNLLAGEGRRVAAALLIG